MSGSGSEGIGRKASRRAEQMPPFMVMEVMEKAAALERQGRSIVHLEVGEPDFDTPPAAVEAGIRALRDGHTHYTHSLGHPELREAISGWYRRKYDLEVSADRIVVTLGSSGALSLVCAALLDTGDRALMTDPGYACYPNFVRAFGGEPVRLKVREADGFQYDPQSVLRSLDARTRLIMLNSPSNPTGIVSSPERLAELVEVVGDRAVFVSDEIYHGLVYEGVARSILEFQPDSVVISGFSKLFAMTGWRLGFAVLPEQLVRPVQKLQQNLFISAPDFAQFAAIAVLQEADAEIERMRQAYDERRRLVLRRLAQMGLEILVEPTGAFYVFVNVRRYTQDVYAFCFRVLEEAGVAITPGVDFGPGGEGFVRISYANSLERIAEGMDRLERFLARLEPDVAGV
ncbi:MAG: pyridoxal phosphate-dependent aminotransferase [Deltaproteobacteria bacterium]|nr:pyridoxal phosphate-dependent aminotransferase [Deltaproteobacteria bacterium]